MSKDLRSYAGRVTVTDGGWGTQLQQVGLPAGWPGQARLWH